MAVIAMVVEMDSDTRRVFYSISDNKHIKVGQILFS